MLLRLLASLCVLLPTAAAQDDGDRERALLRQALTLLAERPMSEGLVKAHADLHGRAWRLGDRETAEAAVRRVVEWWEEQYGATTIALADRFTYMAIQMQEPGNYAGARPLFARALEIREAVLGPDHPDLAATLTNMGMLLAALGDTAAARPHFERALRLREAARGPDHPDVADGLSDLANTFNLRGDLAAARALHERALAIREAALGPHHLDVADSLTSVANVFLASGDYAPARPLYERALAIVEAVHGPDHAAVGIRLNNLAILLNRLGDFAAARPLFERALAIKEAAFGPGHPEVAQCLVNLAVLFQDHGDLAAARPLHERALEILEATVGPDHPTVATALDNLGALLWDLGEREAARPMLERALSIHEAALEPGDPSVAVSLHNLATLRKGAGDFAAAHALLERALATREAALGPHHPDVRESLELMTTLALDAADPAAAFAHAKRLAAHSGQVRRTLATQTTGENYLYLAALRGERDTALAAAAAVGDTAAAYATVLGAKGHVARLTLQTRAQIRAALDPETLVRAQALARLQARLSNLALKTDVADREAHGALLESLRAERDGLDRELRRRVEVDQGVALTPQAVADALPLGSALVDLLVHPAYLPATVVDGDLVEPGGWSEPRLSAWILRTGEGGVRHVDLGPVAPIEVAIRRHLEAVIEEDPADAGLPSDSQPALAPGPALRSRLWEPLVPHLDGVATVFVSPDGTTAMLPFETIPNDAGRFLIEDYTFVYVPDAGVLVERGPRAGPVGSSLLAAGGVDYDRRAELAVPVDPRPDVPSSLARSAGGVPRAFGDNWGGLPESTKETTAIVTAHRTATDAGSQCHLLGAEATEERLKREMPRYAIVHLATHGFFEPEGMPSMRDQALEAVGHQRGMKMTATAARVTGLHPGLLSGLVLAGANHPPGEDERLDDGYLTASEVMLLDLSGVDLVVLSACETGLGRPEAGEGLLGLRRAFFMAGADTVISSLWAVMDDSTSALMQEFYANLFEGAGRHEALRAAQLAMLRRNRAQIGAALPSTWGAFVLSGQWR